MLSVCYFKLSIFLPLCPVPVTPLFLVFFHLPDLCICVCVFLCVCMSSSPFSVCVCAFCSQPLCGEQSLWRALAFHNQSLAPLHTPPPLPRIQTWTHTALVSLWPAHPSFRRVTFLHVGSCFCECSSSERAIQEISGKFLQLAPVKTTHIAKGG